MRKANFISVSTQRFVIHKHSVLVGLDDLFLPSFNLFCCSSPGVVFNLEKLIKFVKSFIHLPGDRNYWQELNYGMEFTFGFKLWMDFSSSTFNYHRPEAILT